MYPETKHSDNISYKKLHLTDLYKCIKLTMHLKFHKIQGDHIHQVTKQIEYNYTRKKKTLTNKCLQCSRVKWNKKQRLSGEKRHHAYKKTTILSSWKKGRPRIFVLAPSCRLSWRSVQNTLFREWMVLNGSHCYLYGINVTKHVKTCSKECDQTFVFQTTKTISNISKWQNVPTPPQNMNIPVQS